MLAFGEGFDASQVGRMEGKIGSDAALRLTHVRDRALRDEILEEAVEKKLSARAVQQLIRSRQPYRGARSERDPPQRLREGQRDPKVLVGELAALARRWRRVHAACTRGTPPRLEGLQRLGREQVTNDLLDELKVTLDGLKAMKKQAGDLVASLAQALGVLKGGQRSK
jgi:hypothetical protein